MSIQISASLNGAVPGAVGVVRRVVINKNEEDGLGLAIVGGKQLGTPILSELFNFIICVHILLSLGVLAFMADDNKQQSEAFDTEPLTDSFSFDE